MPYPPSKDSCLMNRCMINNKKYLFIFVALIGVSLSLE